MKSKWMEKKSEVKFVNNFEYYLSLYSTAEFLQIEFETCRK